MLLLALAVAHSQEDSQFLLSWSRVFRSCIFLIVCLGDTTLPSEARPSSLLRPCVPGGGELGPSGVTSAAQGKGAGQLLCISTSPDLFKGVQQKRAAPR